MIISGTLHQMIDKKRLVKIKVLVIDYFILLDLNYIHDSIM